MPHPQCLTFSGYTGGLKVATSVNWVLPLPCSVQVTAAHRVGEQPGGQGAGAGVWQRGWLRASVHASSDQTDSQGMMKRMSRCDWGLEGVDGAGSEPGTHASLQLLHPRHVVRDGPVLTLCLFAWICSLTCDEGRRGLPSHARGCSAIHGSGHCPVPLRSRLLQRPPWAPAAAP